MGTEESYANEWIELYNPSEKEIDLKQWTLKSEDEGLKIKLESKIPPRDFFLLERTDDKTLPEIKADLVYTGGLNNNGEVLIVLNSKEEIVEKIDCSDSWFAGDNKNKKTMERKDPLREGNDASNWHTSQVKGGTPAKKNSTPKEKESKNELLKQDYNEELYSKEINNFSSTAPIIALVMAFVSATLILILKKTVEGHKS